MAEIRAVAPFGVTKRGNRPLLEMATVPAVSIILPTYNRAAFLPQAFASIRAQQYTDWELIVCDNASVDATAAICRRFAARDPRIRYVRHEQNIGVAANHNHAFALARAPYFKWAHHDVECLLRSCSDEDIVGSQVDAALFRQSLGDPLAQRTVADRKTVLQCPASVLGQHTIDGTTDLFNRKQLGSRKSAGE